jgi:peptide/nickel transport system substrate-binding protein
MTSPLPAAQWGFDESLRGYPYDPDKAKALLKQAGYSDGFKVEFLSYNSPRGYNPAGAELAVAVQGYLTKVGVETSIQKMEMGAFLAQVRSGKYNAGIWTNGFTGDNGDPDQFLTALFGSESIPVSNTARYKNEEVDRILAQAQSISDHDKRVALYKEVQKLILEDAPWIFVNSVLQVRAARKEVKGFTLNPTQMFFDMEKVSLE